MDMNAEAVEPFIMSTQDLFSTMLGCTAVRADSAPANRPTAPREIMALTGLSGVARGMVALIFPEDTALQMVNRLLAADYNALDDTVSDAIAEMANIVAGGAKSRLNRAGHSPIDLSLPMVIRGNGYRIHGPSRAQWREAPFDSELGAFRLRLAFEVNDPRRPVRFG